MTSSKDKPYYELGYSREKPVAPYRSKSDSSPSKTLSWYHRENDKRKSGLENEIDIAEIKAASRGVINSWTCIFKKFPKECHELMETNFNYEEFKKLKDLIN